MTKIFRLPVKMTRSLQFFSWYSIPALRLNASIKAVSCNTCNWGKTLLKNDIIMKYEYYNYKIVGKLCSNKLYHQRCQPLEISNLEIFFWTSTLPPSSFLIWTPLPPSPQAILWEKHQSICQGLQLVEYSSNQTLIFIGVTKKKLSSFCLQQIMCIHTGKWSQKL